MATTNTGATAYEVHGTTSPVTGSAPSAVTGADGQPLNGLSAISVIVSSASGTTLSGAGTLDCYWLDPTPGPNIWVRLPAADFTVTSTTRSHAFVVEVKTPRAGYIKWVPTAVTFSAGSAGVTVWQCGQVPNGVFKGV